jgi:choline dehydrogenase-like flavoprotein
MPALSYWHDSLAPGDALVPRGPLPGDRDADVAVVGAGFTGLWTAYYLLRADPGLRLVVLERETAGFGASGRNGGRPNRCAGWACTPPRGWPASPTASTPCADPRLLAQASPRRSVTWWSRPAV